MSIATDKPPDPGGQQYIFRPWITRPDGTRIYASQYGKRAFRIPIPTPANDNGDKAE